MNGRPMFTLILTIAVFLGGSSHAFAKEGQPDNSIYVGPPMQFSDYTLRAMLDEARKELQSLDVDLSGAQNVGKIQGFERSASASAFEARFVPTVSVKNVHTTTDTLTEDSQGNIVPEETGSIDKDEQATTTTSPSQTQVTIPTVTINNMPPPTQSLGLSALDIVSEKLALFYRYVNLQFLLGKSWSQTFGKQIVVVGFDVSLSPSEHHEDKAAELIMRIPKVDESKQVRPTHVFPMKETYNILSVVEDTSSIGMGLVLGPISLGGSTRSEESRAYLVQDVDTVALLSETETHLEVGWRFRPVLGRSTVSPGIRRVYVSLAVPAGVSPTFETRTRWRSVDRCTGLALGSTSEDRGGGSPQVLKVLPSVLKDPILEISEKNSIVKVGSDLLAIVYGDGIPPGAQVTVGGQVPTFLEIREDAVQFPSGALRDRLTFKVPASSVSSSSPVIVTSEWGTQVVTLGDLFKEMPEEEKPNVDATAFFLNGDEEHVVLMVQGKNLTDKVAIAAGGAIYHVTDKEVTRVDKMTLMIRLPRAAKGKPVFVVDGSGVRLKLKPAQWEPRS